MAETLHLARVLLPGGWREDARLQLDATGYITAIDDGPEQPGDVRITGPVLPGMPNLHSHGFQRAIAGLTGQSTGGEDSFWTWREAMYRLAARITPQSLEALMAGVFVDMLRAGYTSCGEFHYLHHGPDGRPYDDPAELSARVFAGARAAGIGLTHLPVLYCRSGFGADAVAPHQRRFANDPDAYARLLERCRELASGCALHAVGVAPHSLRAVNANELDAAVMLAGDDPVHIHIAEQPREVEECHAHHDTTPLAWLLAQAPVGRNWCLVHATHVTPTERAAAAKTGAVAGLCPTTEADLGDGTFDAVGWVAEGGAFGIGSDSNLRICPAEELRALEFSQRLASGQRNVLAGEAQSCGRFLYERAVRGGARALGQPVGRIEVGRRADLVELDRDHPLLAGLHGDALLDAWLFAGGRDMLASVWVAGERLIERGHHREQASVDAAFQAALRQLRA